MKTDKLFIRLCIYLALLVSASSFIFADPVPACRLINGVTYPTIQDALDSMATVTTAPHIYIEPGYYTSSKNVNLYWPNAQDVNLIGSPTASTILDAGGIGRHIRNDYAVASEIRYLTLINGDVLTSNEMGGSIFLGAAGSQINIYDCIISGNKAMSGGAIYAIDSNITINVQFSTFNHNTAVNNGGAIYDGRKMVYHSYFYDNWASNQGGVFWGNAVGDPTSYIANSRFEMNTAAGAGGVFYQGTQQVMNSIIYGNKVVLSGTPAAGGVFYQGVNSVFNCLIVSNDAISPAGTKGAVFYEGYNAVVNSTFAKNCPENYYDEHSAGDVSGEMTAYNSIFIGNFAPANPSLYANYSTTILNNCATMWIVAGPSTYPAVPPTVVSNSIAVAVPGHFVDYFGNDYHLSSNAVKLYNAGDTPIYIAVSDNMNWMNALSVDLDFKNRILNTTVDIGAYETVYSAAGAPSSNPTGNVSANYVCKIVSSGIEYITIQAALNSAITGSIITIYPGVLTGNGNVGLIWPNVPAITLKAITPSGNSSNVILDARNTTRHILIQYPVAWNIEGLSLVNGRVLTSNSSYDSFGGSILLKDSGLSNYGNIKDCIISGNKAYMGGAIYQYSNSTIIYDNVRLVGNTATYGGGALYAGGNTFFTGQFIGNSAIYGGFAYEGYNFLHGGVVENNRAEFGGVFYRGYNDLGNCTVRYNIATGNTASGGGVFYGEGGVRNHIQYSTLEYNKSGGSVDSLGGGGVFYGGTNDIIGTYIQYNQADQSDGGAFWAGRNTILDSKILGNIAAHEGGAFFDDNNVGSTTINHSLIEGNMATFHGGAFSSGTNTLYGCFVSDNKVTGTSITFGGAFAYGKNKLINSVIVSNSATYSGGAGKGGAFYQGDIFLINSTLAKNEPNIYHDDASGTGTSAGNLYAGNSVFSGIFYGGNVNYANAVTIDYSAFTDSVLPGLIISSNRVSFSNSDFKSYALNDFSLVTGSTGVNSGLTSIWFSNSANITSDIRGNDRIIGSAIDMGAYESSVSESVIVITYNYICKIAASGIEYQTLQAALNSANVGDALYVYPGTYTGTGNVVLKWPNIQDITLMASPNAGNSLNVIIDAQTITRHIVQNYAVRWALENISFINGSSHYTVFNYGGSIYIPTHNSQLTINSCIFINNNSQSGGVIYSFSTGKFNVSSSKFISNNSTQSGGVFSSGYITMNNCLVSGNKASSFGGVFDSSKTAIWDSSFIANSASSLGGVFYSGVNRVYNSIFNANDASGAVFGSGVNTVVNSLFINNYSGIEGVINYGDNLLLNCTFAGNYSYIYYDNSAAGGENSGEMEAYNTIFEGAFNGGLSDSYFNTCTVNYCAFTDKTLPSVMVTANLISGFTTANFANYVAGDFKLATINNPVINAGSNSLYDLSSQNINIDLSGNQRIQGVTIDLGAYESQITANGGATSNSVTSLNGICRISYSSPNPSNPNTYYLTIQEALDNASANAFISIKPSVLTGNGNVGLIWPSVNGIVLMGDTYASGNSVNVILDAQNTTRHMVVNYPVGFNLQNMSFIRGRAQGDNANNTSDQNNYGGSIFISTSNGVSSIVLASVIISGNSAACGAGAIYNGVNAKMSFMNSKINSNSAIATGSGYGYIGAIAGGDNNYYRTEVKNNKAWWVAGAIGGGTHNFTECLIEGNQQQRTNADRASNGGAFYTGVIMLSNCLVSGNLASFGSISNGSKIQARDTRFTNNKSNAPDTKDGHLYGIVTGSYFVDCLIDNNNAYPIFSNGDFRLINTTVAKNGAEIVRAFEATSMGAFNTIFEGTFNGGTDSFVSSGSSANNCIFTDASLPANLTISKGIVGFVTNNFTNYSANDFSIISKSVAVNVGDYNWWNEYTNATRDIAGNLRFVAVTIDIGAYEAQDAVISEGSTGNAVTSLNGVCRIGSAYYLTLQAALNSANVNGIILIKPAILTGNGNVALVWPPTQNITLKADSIAGGNSTNVILDAQGITRHILQTYAVGWILDNIKLINGKVLTDNGAEQARFGGSILIRIDNVAHVLTINECIFTNNTGYYGGAIYAGSTNPYGKSISKINIYNSQFKNNKAGWGGAIYRGDLFVSGSAFESNSAAFDSTSMGGAVCNYNGTSNFESCLISGNSGTWGGAFAYDSNTLKNCTVVNNTGLVKGGVFYSSEAMTNNITVINSTIHHNSAVAEGSVFSYGVNTVINSLIYANASNSGAFYYGDNLLVNSTVVSNSPATYYDNDPNGGKDYGEWEAYNCVLFGTTFNVGIDVNQKPATMDYCATGYTSIFPSTDFKYFAHSITLNKSDFVNYEGGDYHLNLGVAAINAGENTYWNTFSQGIATDLDKQSRIQFVTIDAGAYESAVTPTVFISTKNVIIFETGFGYDTIEDAINAVQDSQHIYLRPGVYTGNENVNFWWPNKENITLMGYPGLGNSKNVVIDGEGTKYFIYQQYSVTWTISDLTIMNMFSTSSGGGAALYIDASAVPTLYLYNVILSNNVAASTSPGGGAIRGSSYYSFIDQCAFISNNAGTNRAGGAIYGGTNVISASVFLGNKTVGSSSTAHGGVIYGGNNSIYNSVFEGNTAAGNGGVFYGSTTQLDRCIIRNNMASSGGVYSGVGGTFIVKNSFIEGNMASPNNTFSSGGVSDGSNNTVHSSIISGNIAAGDGGVFYYGINELINTLVVGNCTFGSKGGSVFFEGQNKIVNSTFAKNNNSIFFDRYSGLSSGAQYDGEILAYNTIFEGTFGRYYDAISNIAPVTLDHCVLIDTANYTGVVNLNPITGFSTDQFTNYSVNDFSLKSNSLAINAGATALWLASSQNVSTDVVGNARLIATIDVGAYESNILYVTPNVIKMVCRNISSNIEFSTIQIALNSANIGDTILIYPGILTGNGNVGLVWPNKQDITLMGSPNAGSSINVILDAQSVTRHIIQANNVRWTLDNLSFINGNVSPNANGGSIYFSNNASTLYITNCIISGNVAKNGGAIAAGNSGMSNIIIISSSVFSENKATNANSCDGGVFYYGKYVIESSSFINNQAKYTGAFYGVIMTANNVLIQNNRASQWAGVFQYSIANISNSIISGNVAGNNGGVFQNTTVNVVNSKFSNNIAYQGAVFMFAAASVNNCIFEGNVAVSNGGIAQQMSITIKNSIIRNNRALSHSGVFGNTSVQAFNSTFFENQAPHAVLSNGGADNSYVNCLIYNNLASANGTIIFGGKNKYTNCTFANNIGDILNNNNDQGTFIANNSIFLGSFDSTANNYFEFTTFNYCALSDSVLAVSINNINPISGIATSSFVELGNNDFHLTSVNNVAINSGFNPLWNASSLNITTDIEGNPRIQGATIDIGAYESFVITSEIIPPIVDIFVCKITSSGVEYKTIQEALDNVKNGQTIYVFAGAYQTSGNIDLVWPNTQDVVLMASPNAGMVTLMGDDGVNHHRGIIQNYPVRWQLSDISFRYCQVSGNGAAIYITTANINHQLTLNNITFWNNYAWEGYGGAIYVAGRASQLSIISCNFIGNAAAFGGALYSGKASIINTAFSGNGLLWNGPTVYATNGGAIYAGIHTIISSNFTGNKATNFGGAIAGDITDTVNFTMVDSTVMGNEASSYVYGHGGAFYWVAAEIRNSSFISNNANVMGGVYDNATISFNNCLIRGNTTSQGGSVGRQSRSFILSSKILDNTAGTGGIFAGNGDSRILVNSVIAGNTAYSGAAVFNYGNNKLINCTVAKNDGPIFMVSDSSASLFAQNSVFFGEFVSGNTSAFARATVNYSAFGPNAVPSQVATFNCVNLIVTSSFVDYSDYNFMPTGTGNVLFNAGNTAYWMANSYNITADILGLPRIIDNIIDLGAYEYGVTLSGGVVPSSNPTGNNLSLKYVITDTNGSAISGVIVEVKYQEYPSSNETGSSTFYAGDNNGVVSFSYQQTTNYMAQVIVMTSNYIGHVGIYVVTQNKLISKNIILLSAPHSIQGKIENSNGQGVANTSIFALQDNDYNSMMALMSGQVTTSDFEAYASRVTSNFQGDYNLKLSTGSWTLALERQDDSPAIITRNLSVPLLSIISVNYVIPVYNLTIQGEVRDVSNNVVQDAFISLINDSVITMNDELEVLTSYNTYSNSFGSFRLYANVATKDKVSILVHKGLKTKPYLEAAKGSTVNITDEYMYAIAEINTALTRDVYLSVPIFLMEKNVTLSAVIVTNNHLVTRTMGIMFEADPVVLTDDNLLSVKYLTFALSNGYINSKIFGAEDAPQTYSLFVFNDYLPGPAATINVNPIFRQTDLLITGNQFITIDIKQVVQNSVNIHLRFLDQAGNALSNQAVTINMSTQSTWPLKVVLNYQTDINGYIQPQISANTNSLMEVVCVTRNKVGRIETFIITGDTIISKTITLANAPFTIMGRMLDENSNPLENTRMFAVPNSIRATRNAWQNSNNKWNIAFNIAIAFTNSSGNYILYVNTDNWNVYSKLSEEAGPLVISSSCIVPTSAVSVNYKLGPIYLPTNNIYPSFNRNIVPSNRSLTFNIVIPTDAIQEAFEILADLPPTVNFTQAPLPLIDGQTGRGISSINFRQALDLNFVPMNYSTRNRITTFNSPINLSIPVYPNLLNTRNARVYYYNEVSGNWSESGITIDAVYPNRILFRVNHLTYFSLAEILTMQTSNNFLQLTLNVRNELDQKVGSFNTEYEFYTINEYGKQKYNTIYKVDYNGITTLNTVLSGDCFVNVIVSRTGYNGQYKNYVVTGNRNVSESININLAPYTLTGRIFNTSGNNVINKQVFAISANKAEELLSWFDGNSRTDFGFIEAFKVSTDVQGMYGMNLSSGSWNIYVAVSADSQPVQIRRGLIITSNLSGIDAMVDGNPSVNSVLLNVRMTDCNNNPLANSKVWFETHLVSRNNNNLLYKEAKYTDASGLVSINYHNSDLYFVTAIFTASGNLAVFKNYMVTQDRYVSESIRLSSANYVVTGRMVDFYNNPLSNIVVYALPTQNMESVNNWHSEVSQNSQDLVGVVCGYSTTNVDGTFRMFLDDRDWTLVSQLSSNAQSYLINQNFHPAINTSLGDIVYDTDTTNNRFEYRFRIKDQNNALIPTAEIRWQVRVSSNSGSITENYLATNLSNAVNTISFQTSLNYYVVALDIIKPGYVSKVYNFVISRDRYLSENVVISMAPYSINGKLVDGMGVGTANIEVIALYSSKVSEIFAWMNNPSPNYDDLRMSYVRTTTNISGNYSLKVGTGNWAVMIRNDLFGSSPYNISNNVVLGSTEPTKTISDFTVALYTTINIVGTVRDSNGQVISHSLVGVANTSTIISSVIDLFSGVRTTNASVVDGSFSLTFKTITSNEISLIAFNGGDVVSAVSAIEGVSVNVGSADYMANYQRVKLGNSTTITVDFVLTARVVTVSGLLISKDVTVADTNSLTFLMEGGSTSNTILDNKNVMLLFVTGSYLTTLPTGNIFVELRKNLIVGSGNNDFKFRAELLVTDSMTYDIYLTSRNRVPILIVSTTSIIVRECEKFTIIISANDLDNDLIKVVVSNNVFEQKTYLAIGNLVAQYKYQTDYSEAGTYNIYVTVSDNRPAGEVVATISVIVLDVGNYVLGASSNLQIIGIPEGTVTRSIKAMSWDNDIYNYVTITSNQFEAGKGYWVRITENLNVDLSTVAANTTNKKLRIKRGWNQISNPYGYDVDWNNLVISYNGQTYNGTGAITYDILYNGVYKYNGMSYEAMVISGNTSMKPWEGYWIAAIRPFELIVPSRNNTMNVQNLVQSSGLSMLSLEVRVSGLENNGAVALIAGDGNSKFVDLLSPPLLGSTKTSIHAEKEGMSYMASQQSFNHKRMQWTIKVTSEEAGNVGISLREIENKTGEVYQYKLLDANGKELKSGPGEAIVYVNSGTTAFQVVAINSVMLPALYYLKNYPNPFNPDMGQVSRIAYNMGTGTYTVKVSIYTVHGRKLRVLDKSLANAVDYIDWNGRDDNGVMMPNDAYIYIISLKDSTGVETKSKGKIVLWR